MSPYFTKILNVFTENVRKFYKVLINCEDFSYYWQRLQLKRQTFDEILTLLEKIFDSFVQNPIILAKFI